MQRSSKVVPVNEDEAAAKEEGEPAPAEQGEQEGGETVVAPPATEEGAAAPEAWGEDSEQAWRVKEEHAALKVQASFRGFQARKRVMEMQQQVCSCLAGCCANKVSTMIEMNTCSPDEH